MSTEIEYDARIRTICKRLGIEPDSGNFENFPRIILDHALMTIVYRLDAIEERLADETT